MPSSGPARYRQRRVPQCYLARAMELGVACAGAALIVIPWFADTAWFDSHFLPSFFTPRHQLLTVLTALRIATALLGLALILVLRPRISRYASKRPVREVLGKAAMAVIVVIAALLSSELILRTQKTEMAQFHNLDEPLRVADPALGWVLMPSHHGHDLIAGRRIEYVTDVHGYRIASMAEQPYPARPTILFVGESVIEGFGLQWRETIPARVGVRLGIQPVNIAVSGYSTDQSYLQLRSELPRLSCPVAVVSIFMTSFLNRNINVDRPHLDSGLRLHPTRHGWRLAALARRLVPYRSSSEIKRGIAMTKAVLGATTALARSRGAASLIVVPVFTPESAAETTLRQHVLDEAGLDYLLVPVDSRWRLGEDMHPDARADSVIAAAISARLNNNRQEHACYGN
jgi:hypothetical protein